MIASLQYAAAQLLAADVDPVTGRDPEWGKAAPAGLLVWLFLGAMLFLLIKSMNRHLRRVPKSFDSAATGGGADFDSRTVDDRADAPESVDPEAAADLADAVEETSEPTS